MKKYKMLKAAGPEEAEDLMNRAVKKGWRIFSVFPYTHYFDTIAIVVEKDVEDPQDDPFAGIRKE